MGTKERLSALIILFFLFCFLLLARLFYWQVLKAEELEALAVNQRENIRKIPAFRGQILAQDNFPLVGNQQAFLLFADLTKIKAEDKQKIAKDLSSFLLKEEEATFSGSQKEALLEVKEEKIKELLNFQDKVWVPLKHKILAGEKEIIEKMNFKGLGFEEETVRFYPEASMAAQMLGFMGANLAGEPTGYFGLEGYYDLELRGKEGLLIQEKDAGNLPILTGFFNQEKKKDGKNLILHLDRTIQSIAEEELIKGVNKYGANSGYVVIMDPLSGAILAMAAYPSYNPDKFFKYESQLYKNPVVAELYEPGSTFKVLVMSAALNERAITPQTRCEICTGPLKIDKYTIKTWNDKYYAQQTMNEIIQHSDNVGMVFVSQKLGKEKLIDYLEKFGIGEKTGIDLQEEVTVPLKKKKDWSEVDLTTASFGQGLAVTGIQMVRAVAAVANGGKLLEPHMVDKMVGEDKTLTIKPKITREVLKQKTSEEMTAMMVNAVNEGEAKWAKPQGYQIAGKTGTAQIPVAGHYDEDKTITSFVGFAPANKPRFVMLVYLREPTSSPWGSETAAPLFFRIASRIFLYLGIQPAE